MSWDIKKARDDAEKTEARWWRGCAAAPAAVGGVVLVVAAVLPLGDGARQQREPGLDDLRLAALLITAALLILPSRILWNYSIVWLGRAGTLEDLGAQAHWQISYGCGTTR